jgi:predicted membrane channel-forming protein YqfA (hemolysin III family)
MSQHLLNIDLIGITFMTFVSPYFYYVGGPEGMDIYCSVLFCTQVVCILMFASNLVFGESNISAALEQPLLFGLASVGNLSTIRLLFVDTVDIQQRVVSAVSLVLLVTGYAFCFINHWPEVFLPDGASDGKIWNSHVIWHGMLFVTQMLYLLSPVMLDCYFE